MKNYFWLDYIVGEVLVIVSYIGLILFNRGLK